MVQYSKEQYRKIFKTGSDGFNIEDNHFIGDLSLELKFTSLPIDDIIPFIEYQIEGNDYKKILQSLIWENFKKKKVPEKNQQIIYNWLLESTNLNKLFLGRISQLFKQPKWNEDNVDSINEWDYEIRKFLNGKDSVEVKNFLTFGKGLLKEKYDIHLVICSDRFDCPINNVFEQRIQKTESITKEIIQFEEEAKSGHGKSGSIKKLQWLGTQKELAELFIELKKNGWIEKFEFDTIKSCFTKSNTIQQPLKPNTNTSTGENEYLEVYTSQYSPKFHGLKENPKK